MNFFHLNMQRDGNRDSHAFAAVLMSMLMVLCAAPWLADGRSESPAPVSAKQSTQPAVKLAQLKPQAAAHKPG